MVGSLKWGRGQGGLEFFFNMAGFWAWIGEGGGGEQFYIFFSSWWVLGCG